MNLDHICEYYIYPANANKDKIYEELQEIVKCRSEGSLDHIRWLDRRPCTNKQAAEKFIEANDSGWFDCLAVRYYGITDVAAFGETEEYKRLANKLSLVAQKYISLNEKLFFENKKTEFVLCKNCRSKLALAYLPSNLCPVCNSDMRSKSTIDRLNGYKRAMSSIYYEINAERLRYLVKAERAAGQQMKGTKINWLVKIEYSQPKSD